jgi:hypothetical protein
LYENVKILIKIFLQNFILKSNRHHKLIWINIGTLIKFLL